MSQVHRLCLIGPWYLSCLQSDIWLLAMSQSESTISDPWHLSCIQEDLWLLAMLHWSRHTSCSPMLRLQPLRWCVGQVLSSSEETKSSQGLWIESEILVFYHTRLKCRSPPLTRSFCLLIRCAVSSCSFFYLWTSCVFANCKFWE